jgi:Zn-dependent protease/predicted transcriptional regulator
MRASIKLGRWFGVPVGLHYSWFIIAWLIAISLRAEFAAVNPSWSPAMVWTLSILTAALFFVCIVLHELSHATVARFSGVPVRGITLFALGGVAQIEKEAETPGKEFWIAIAGPAASIALGLACYAIAGATGLVPPGTSQSAVIAVVGWLAYINVALALFNLIPGFPLDGGRILRSVIWAANHDAQRATRAAARVGQAIAFLFIAGGLWALITRGDFGGLWIAFIGWFLLEGAQSYYLQAQLSTTLQGLRVSDVMSHGCAPVDGHTTLRRFIDEHLLHGDATCFAVNDDGHVVGLIGPEDVKAIDRSRWDETRVSEAMHPLRLMHPVKPDVPADEALALMGRERLNQLPVVSDGHLEGVVTMASLARLLRVRQELHA